MRAVEDLIFRSHFCVSFSCPDSGADWADLLVPICWCLLGEVSGRLAQASCRRGAGKAGRLCISGVGRLDGLFHHHGRESIDASPVTQ